MEYSVSVLHKNLTLYLKKSWLCVLRSVVLYKGISVYSFEYNKFVLAAKMLFQTQETATAQYWQWVKLHITITLVNSIGLLKWRTTSSIACFQTWLGSSCTTWRLIIFKDCWNPSSQNSLRTPSGLELFWYFFSARLPSFWRFWRYGGKYFCCFFWVFFVYFELQNTALYILGGGGGLGGGVYEQIFVVT